MSGRVMNAGTETQEKGLYFKLRYIIIFFFCRGWRIPSPPITSWLIDIAITSVDKGRMDETGHLQDTTKYSTIATVSDERNVVSTCLQGA